MPTQWSEAEQVPLGCIAPPFSHHIPGGQSPAPTHVLPMACALYVRADVGIRPYTRSAAGHFVGGDALIAPYAAAAPRHQASLVQREVSQPLAVTDGLSKRIFRAPARGTFALGGKSTQKRRSNLRFENSFARLHPPRILTAFATRTLCPANFP